MRFKVIAVKGKMREVSTHRRRDLARDKMLRLQSYGYRVRVLVIR